MFRMDGGRPFPAAPRLRRWFWGALLLVLLPRLAVGEDLGIVRVVAQPSGSPAAQFTATHLGNGLLLTCGHCCRYAGGPRSTVEIRILRAVDQQPYRTTPGRVLCYDSAADVGLLRLDDPQALKTAYRLAPEDFQAAVGQAVLMYGWNDQGDRLHSLRSVVVSVDLFDGPANLQTRDHPHPGDSGSPLVSLPDGHIMGVTTGADALDRFGVHCGTAPIYRLMDRCQIVRATVQPASATQE